MYRCRLQPPIDSRAQALPGEAAIAPSASSARAGTQRRSEGGFTLVELITVILILGVLAAVALPRFTNLQARALDSKVKAIAGAMNAASSLVKASAMAAQVSCGAATGTSVALEGLSVALNHCYPQALGTFGQGVLGAANVTAVDGWVIGSNPGAAAAGSVLTIQLPEAAVPANCSITYTSPAAAAASPTIATTVSGC